MGRPVPRKFSEDELKKYEEAAAKQSSKTRIPLTTDENKYPMFEIPVNGKALIYVPNLTTTEYNAELEQEEKVLIMDKGAFHTVRQRGSFVKYRCSADIDGIEGFDGTCPLCQAMSENWELYNLQYADAGAKKGIDINSEAAKDGLKEERNKLLREMAISNKVIYYTFPIVHIALKEGTLNWDVDANGVPKHRVEWYSIAESTYNNKWASILAALPPGEQKTAAGRWFILDYTYESKSGQYTKMKSSSELKVIHRPMFGKDQELNNKIVELEKYFDELAKDWTPALAKDVIFANMVYDVPALTEIAEEVMVPTRDKLLIYKSARGVSANNQLTGDIEGSPEQIINNFQATKAEIQGEVNVGAIPE